MINNNGELLQYVEDKEHDMIGCSFLTYVSKPVCLSLLYSFMIFDAFLFFMITTMKSQYHIKFTQIDTTMIYMHAG